MFDIFQGKKQKKNGTPVKRRKLNQISSFDEDIDLGLNLTKKKSLIDCFHFIGPINRKDSYKLPMLRKQSNLNYNFPSLGSFKSDDGFELGNPKNLHQGSLMDLEFPQAQNYSSSSQQQLPRDIKLVKRVTMMNIPNMEVLPKLFRCNSGIIIEEQINETDERKYGDNIYLEQINALHRRNTMNSKENNSRAANRNFKQNYNRKTYQIQSDDDEEQNKSNAQERLLEDYEISSNLNAYVRHHENYLCLNKLERIFYYVKKINFSDDYTQEDIFQLCQLQIKLYNRDDESHMLRFYQSWEEQDCVYLVFETASTSLQEKIQSGIKLRENQVWSLITDACAALNWMKQSDQYHLNIKPGNLLRCREKFKLSDPFVNGDALSRALNMFKGQEYEEEKLRLAFNYAAPEILEFRSFIQGLNFEKCDVYSLGLCILENLTGISVSILKRDLKFIKKNNQKYLKGYSPMLKNLLMKMISMDPLKRPTPEQIAKTRQLQFFELKKKTDSDDKKSHGKPKRKLSL